MPHPSQHRTRYAKRTKTQALTYEQAMYQAAKDTIAEYHSFLFTGYQGTYKRAIAELLHQASFFIPGA